MNEQLATYYTYKMALSIPFDMKESDFEYNNIYFNLLVMDYLKLIVETFTKENLISKKVEDNIKNYLLQARDYQDKNRKERIDIINDILSSLNSQENDNSLGLYIYELMKRRNSKKYLFKPISEIKSEIDKVHQSIVNDYLVLFTHSESMSDEVFNQSFLDKFVKSELYFESLNVILNEMPQVFTNSIFYERVMDVLSTKKFFEKKNNKLIEKIDKKIKQINRMK